MSGCQEVTNSYPADESRFIGKWSATQVPLDSYLGHNTDYSIEKINLTWEFFEDNTIIEKAIYDNDIENMSGGRRTYELNGQIIIVKIDNLPSNFIFEYRYEFSNDYNTLSLDYLYNNKIYEDFYVFTRII